MPSGVRAIGVDLTEAMLRRAVAKADRGTALVLMNAEQLGLNAEAFDAVALNLILSVVERPKQALAEAARVVRPEGRILVFDKFLADGASPSLGPRLLNTVATRVGTDVNRQFGSIAAGVPLVVETEEPARLPGGYRMFMLRRESSVQSGSAHRTR